MSSVLTISGPWLVAAFPRPVFDYLDGGADGEVTLRENCRVFDDVTFRPRHAVALSECDLRTRVLGFDVSFPALLAPVGYSRLMHPDGEAGAARAAGLAGTAYILSTISGHRVEDVKAASTGPVCFQLYLMGGRAASEAIIERARVAGCSALVVTIDTPVAGLRERDYRNGMKELMSGSLLEKIPFLASDDRPPRLDRQLPARWRLVQAAKCCDPRQRTDGTCRRQRRPGQRDSDLEDLKWIRNLWPGPMVIKGVLTGEDARRAVDEGAAAVVVSNHGGRQLDGVRASLRALPEVVAAVNGQAEVLDGRRSSSRLRHRQSGMPRSPRRSVRPRLCLWPGRRRSGWRHPRSGNPACRRRAHSQAAGLPIHRRARSFVCGCARELAVRKASAFSIQHLARFSIVILSMLLRERGAGE